MGYRINERRIELDASGAAVEELILAVYDLVVPRFTRKLYFVPENDCPWSKLTALANQKPNFKVISRDEWPMNLCDRFRIFQDGPMLYVIPDDDSEVDLTNLAKLLTG